MKTLTLIRHAKSSWKDDNLDDIDRPLNKRGNRDAPMMGKRLSKRSPAPQLLVTSPAVRAKDTADSIAYEISYPTEEIEEQTALYHASEDDILDAVHALDDDLDDVWLVGHNPGLQDFVEKITGFDMENLPTCAVVILQFETNRWSKIHWGEGRVVEFDFPKNLSDTSEISD